MSPATLTIGIDPTLELGPVTLAWHGIMTATGLALGASLALRFASRRGLSRDALLAVITAGAISGIIGARLWFLLEQDPGALLRPGDWIGTRGFAFWGAIVGGALGAGASIRRRRLEVAYLDALAGGLPLGMAVGRLGDVANGEHTGPPSGLPWAIRWTHADTEAPSTELSYHSGGLYEVLLALALLALVWALRDRLPRAGQLFALVVGAYAAGRFVMFFVRDDSPPWALGLAAAQWTSLLVLAAAIAFAALATRRSPRAPSGPPSGSHRS